LLIVTTVFGLALPVLAWVLAVARYRRVNRALTRPGAPALPAGGAAMLVATFATGLTGVLALLLVVR
jgi:hypothetical protein